MPVLVLIAVLAIFWVMMRYTVYGRAMYAIGSNPSAARLVGVRLGRFIFIGFILSAAACALSGLVLTSQLGVGSGLFGVGMELSVITAIVLGGTSLGGGRGSVVGTAVGLLIIGSLNNGLTLTGVDPFWQDVARGTLLIGAVSFDRLRRAARSADAARRHRGPRRARHRSVEGHRQVHRRDAARPGRKGCGRGPRGARSRGHPRTRDGRRLARARSRRRSPGSSRSSGLSTSLVLNAGVYVVETLEETTFESWRRTMDVNLDGAFLCARRALPSMRERGYGRRRRGRVERRQDGRQAAGRRVRGLEGGSHDARQGARVRVRRHTASPSTRSRRR